MNHLDDCGCEFCQEERFKGGPMIYIGVSWKEGEIPEIEVFKDRIEAINTMIELFQEAYSFTIAAIAATTAPGSTLDLNFENVIYHACQGSYHVWVEEQELS